MVPAGRRRGRCAAAGSACARSRLPAPRRAAGARAPRAGRLGLGAGRWGGGRRVAVVPLAAAAAGAAAGAGRRSMAALGRDGRCRGRASPWRGFEASCLGRFTGVTRVADHRRQRIHRWRTNGGRARSHPPGGRGVRGCGAAVSGGRRPADRLGPPPWRTSWTPSTRSSPRISAPSSSRWRSSAPCCWSWWCCSPADVPPGPAPAEA